MDDRSLVILEAVARLANGATPRAIAAEAGLPQATAYRRVNEMEAMGLLEAADGAYRLGSRLYRLLSSGLSQETLRHRLAAPAASLAEATGEVCFAARLASNRVEIFLTERPGAPRGASVVPPHGLRPATVCSAAKAILAFVPSNLRRDVVSYAREALPHAPQKSSREFEADLHAVRETGVADCIGEEDPDCASIAAPVRFHGGYGQVCLGLSGPLHRIRHKVQAGLVTDLKARIEAIEHAGILD